MAAMLTPSRRAASGLPPMAVSWRPAELRVISSQVSSGGQRRHQDRQGDADQVAAGGLGLEQDDAGRPPVGQVVDRLAAGHPHQQREVDAHGGDGDDDRGDAQIVDQRRVQAAERQARPAGRARCRQRRRQAPGRGDIGRDVLRDRGRRRERDVDPAGDQHDEHAQRQDGRHRIALDQVDEVGEGQEVGAGQPSGSRRAAG